MTWRSSLRIAAACTLLVPLAACASLPSGFEQEPSRTWQHPEETQLGAFFGGLAPADPGLSGVRLLSDPREAFNARFGMASLAEKSLDMQYYLWKGDTTGRLLLHRALQAADRGVRVRLLMDDIFHAGRDKVYSAIDAHPQVEVRLFNPIGNRGLGRHPNFLFNKRELNHRMHNKIFLIDNAVAVLGGRNIGDDYFGRDPKLNFRDLDALAVGPVAQEAGAAFDLYWNSRAAVPIAALVKRAASEADLEELRAELEASLEELDSLPYTVPLEFEEARATLSALADDLIWAEAEIIVDPLDRFEGGAESEFVRLFEGIAASIQNELVVQTAYLIPSDEGIDGVAGLTAHGVRVRILTNSLLSNNHISVHAHYMKYRKRLLEAGVELHELRADPELLAHYKQMESHIADSNAGLHTKAFVIDGCFSIIGSYNLDPRSRIWNSEIALMVHSEEFATRVLANMETDFEPSNSYRLTLDEKGKLRWTGEGPEGPEVWRHDPAASWWRRAAARFISWIPVESEL